ncbi:hypothetical protein KOW79_000148 [Hemibagrus wyckioides]|uniref:Uncharacterized protein n=1 Tax=Hemibagrus wyckioides TaxID=337641 RepID=A0A9D3P646_9TELE|nr:hypothetical protein KOW79_000148 [Hemibagrus wyckioides]
MLKRGKKVKKTMEDLKKKYETKSGEIKSFMNEIETDIRELENEKIRLVEECYECVDKLEEIALKSDSVYTLQHLDYLIEKVKKTGNTDRVQKLQEMKKRADDKQLAQATKWFCAMALNIPAHFSLFRTEQDETDTAEEKRS